MMKIIVLFLVIWFFLAACGPSPETPTEIYAHPGAYTRHYRATCFGMADKEPVFDETVFYNGWNSGYYLVFIVSTGMSARIPMDNCVLVERKMEQ